MLLLVVAVSLSKSAIIVPGNFGGYVAIVAESNVGSYSGLDYRMRTLNEHTEILTSHSLQ